MKKLRILLLFLCLAYLLAFGQAAACSARDGLLLWYHSVLPVLFPFMFLCSLFLRLNLFESLPRFFYAPICRLFGCSPHGAFAVITGFLCGFPMGAKITSDLYEQQKISRTEAKFLYGFVNNLSPGFILSYIAVQQLGDAALGFALLVPILGSAMLYGILTSIFFRHSAKLSAQTVTALHSAKDSQNDSPVPDKTPSFFLTLDQCLYHTIQNVVKLGGYITLFCMLVDAFTNLFPASEQHSPLLLLFSCIEITNGVRMIAASCLPFLFKYLCITAVSAFGGLSALMQTLSLTDMDRDLLFYYIKSRVLTTLLAVCIAVCSVLFRFFFL